MPRMRMPSSMASHPSAWESTIDHLDDTPSPGKRSSQEPEHSSSISTALRHPSISTALRHPQEEILALQPGVQEQEAALQKTESQEEVNPGDVRYRLEPLIPAPLQMQDPHVSSLDSMPPPLSFSPTHEECFKPWKREPVTYHREKPFHAVPLASTSSGTFLSPGESPVLEPPIQQGTVRSREFGPPASAALQAMLGYKASQDPSRRGKKVTPSTRQGHGKHIVLNQRDFQAPASSEVPTPDPDKGSQGIHKYSQRAQEDRGPGWQPTAQVHREPSRPQQETAVPGGKRTAEFNGDTVTRMMHLPPFMALVKRVKGMFLSSTPEVFKAKAQTQTTSKRFFQDQGARPQVLYRLHYRSSKKPWAASSPAPAADQPTSRTTYMPLFSERMKLRKPKANSIKSEASTSSSGQGKSIMCKGETGSFLGTVTESVYGKESL